MEAKSILVKGARVHNLKGVNVEIPRGALVVITGVSGSGKSSLAFDTIYAEGYRRYVESLSSYARQFLEVLEKPDVDEITGLTPSIAIDQKSVPKTPRSTVATVTEIYDHLRLLFARLGKPICPNCNIPISSQSVREMVDAILSLPEGTKAMLLAPVVKKRKGEHRELLASLRRNGFVRARIDGEIVRLDQQIELDKNRHHTIEVVVDRIKVSRSERVRITDSVELALKISDGLLILWTPEGERVFSERFGCPYCGFSISEISPRLFSFNFPLGACPECKGIGKLITWEEEFRKTAQVCPVCGGARLKKEALCVLVGGKNIYEVTCMCVDEALEFFNSLEFTGSEGVIAERLLKEIRARLEFLKRVGLGYITLNRETATLSGGEAQRVRLATQIGSGLSGVTYVLDEPTVGLHPRDTAMLIENLKRLKDLGNTVIVVEHDRDVIEASDYIVDLGPGAGEYGGQVVFQGPTKEIVNCRSSITGAYLSGKASIETPIRRRIPKGFLRFNGVNFRNLKGIDVEIPLGCFVCITGVSGSGKSTLLMDVIYPALARGRKRGFKSMRVFGRIDNVILVDQSPIGRTPRSNPATYVGAFTPIRELFAKVPEARARGYTPSRFSFNLKGGRCEKCSGEGYIKVDMLFLPDLYVKCDECNGKRYNRETLEILYKGKSIADVLDMTVDEALKFFENIPAVRRKLRTLKEVGLGYIRLGQPATTLSGGEAQRVKLAKELSKRDTGNTLYILDEPTVGLHMEDVRKLVEILHKLVDRGNTVVVIEHNLDVIKNADYIIDLGPEGGENGGTIVAEGTPEEVAKSENSYTALFLRRVLPHLQHVKRGA